MATSIFQASSTPCLDTPEFTPPKAPPTSDFPADNLRTISGPTPRFLPQSTRSHDTQKPAVVRKEPCSQ